jgi:hypothetical protein
MTYQELAAEIVRLPLPERLALLELVTRSLREELARQPRAGSLAARLRGIGKPDGPPPTDDELRSDYTDYLAEKYS